MVEVMERLSEIDARLLDWLSKRDLEPRSIRALVRARALLNEIGSWMVVAGIVDPKDYQEFREREMEHLKRAASGVGLSDI